MADAWFVRMRSHLFNTRLDDEQPRVSFLRLFGCQDEFRPHQRRADRTLANALQADAGHPEFFHRTGLEQVGCVIIQQLLLFIYAPNRMSKHVLATLGKAIAPSSRLEELGQELPLGFEPAEKVATQTSRTSTKISTHFTFIMPSFFLSLPCIRMGPSRFIGTAFRVTSCGEPCSATVIVQSASCCRRSSVLEIVQMGISASSHHGCYRKPSGGTEAGRDGEPEPLSRRPRRPPRIPAGWQRLASFLPALSSRISWHSPWHSPS